MISRKYLRDRYLQQINQLKSISAEDLTASAIVFAPHQDDETLGCGGTIICKRQAEADVKIVFMTDGSLANNNLMPETELILLRQQEAIKAAQTLNVAPENVLFLGFRDGALRQSKTTAIAQVQELLTQNQPQQIFIPYIRETHPDHLATTQIVLAALTNYQPEITIYEYPVWYWNHFPWTSQGKGKSGLKYLKTSIEAKLGWQLIQDFNYRVGIEAVKSQKQLALAQHETQMKRLIDSPNWTILQDISGGEWLECFFQTQEIFRRTVMRGATSG